MTSHIKTRGRPPIMTRMNDANRRGVYTPLGYRSVSVASYDGRTATRGSGAYHERYDRGQLIDQSRQFFRDNGIYRGMIDRAASYIVGNGFSLQAKTSNAKWNADVERLWREFWRSPEIKQVVPGRRIERMVCRELLLAGDTGAIKTDLGLLQLVEAEQIARKTRGKNQDNDGIDKDEWGRPTQFWVSPYGSYGRVTTSNAKSYTPEEFLFITDPERPSSIRGVPPCQAVFPMLHRINDVCDSEAIAWQILARVAVSITRQGGAELGHQESTEDTTKSSTDASTNLTDRMTELDYALLFHGEPGEEIRGVERNIPGKDFSQSLIMFLRLLGLPLGLPLEVILLDWTKSNYSQSRAVLEQAYQTFIGWQLLIEDFFYRPVYEWKVTKWIASGRLTTRRDAFAHECLKPTYPWLDQLKEVEAWGEKAERGFATHQQICKSLGFDRQDIVTAREEEVRDAIERAKQIEAETGVAVPWQIFAGLKPESGSSRRDIQET